MSGDPLWPAWATEPVDLVDADPAWIVQGEQERDQLETLLAPWLIARIEHVGSTAIPDLPAIRWHRSHQLPAVHSRILD